MAGPMLYPPALPRNAEQKKLWSFLYRAASGACGALGPGFQLCTLKRDHKQGGHAGTSAWWSPMRFVIDFKQSPGFILNPGV